MAHGARLAVLLLAFLVLGGCRSADASRESASAATSTAEAPVPAISASRHEAGSRVVALGDVHGDIKATRAALRLAGLVDEGDRWVGGTSVVVQTGDILDRGNDEQDIIDLFENLKKQARDAGGRVHVLNGNHELMNAAGDFRYVTPGGLRDFEGLPGLKLDDPDIERRPPAARARWAALRPGGMYARKLAPHPVVVVVGNTVFAHGGVLPKHVRYGIDRLNREVGEWLEGRGNGAGRRIVATDDSPVWSRHFSDKPDRADCALLQKSLRYLGVKRMVVGHTVHRTIQPACDQKVWRIDVGMSAHYGGKPQVLELNGDAVRVLR